MQHSSITQSKNEYGNKLKQNPTYDRVTTSDGRRVARTSEYVRDDQGYPQTVYHYYPVLVEKIGNPKIGSGTYYSVIPDLDNELTDVESAKQLNSNINTKKTVLFETVFFV